MAEIKDEWTDGAGNVYRLRTSEIYVLEQNGKYATGAGFLSRHAWLVAELAGERECHGQAALDLHHASEKNAELEAALESKRDELGTTQESLRGTEAVSAEQAREIARLQRELAESRGVWRLAVRELLRPVPDLVREPPRAALDDADALRASPGTLSKIAEAAGWQGEEPLAEWLTAALAGTCHLAYLRCSQLAAAHGFQASGPQTISGFFAQKVDRAARFADILRLANAHGFGDAEPETGLEDFLASKIAHNERIAQSHRQALAQADKSLTTARDRISNFQLRFQELLQLAKEALEI